MNISFLINSNLCETLTKRIASNGNFVVICIKYSIPHKGGVILYYLFKRIIIPSIFILFLEQAFSLYLTGNIATSVERKALIFIPLLLSIVFNVLVTPPEIY